MRLAPTLAISPGPPRGQVGADIGWLHEVKNQQAALDAVCDRGIRVDSADELPEVIADIFAGKVLNNGLLGLSPY